MRSHGAGSDYGLADSAKVGSASRSGERWRAWRNGIVPWVLASHPMRRRLQFTVIVFVLAMLPGCRTVLDGMIESAFDSLIETSSEREDREINEDFRRLRQRKQLKHHDDEKDLRRHRFERKFYESYRAQCGRR